MKLRALWSNLENRERIIITIGVALILLTALWLLFSSLFDERQQLRDEINGQRMSLQVMEQRAELISNLNNNCSEQNLEQQQPQVIIAQLARRYRVNTEVEGRSSGFYRVVVNAQNGNDILRFGHHLICEGFSLQSIMIENIDDNPLSRKGQLEMNYDN